MGYLDNKRRAFPRFYFVSDPCLLALLSRPSDLESVKPHLRLVCYQVWQLLHEQTIIKTYHALLTDFSFSGTAPFQLITFALLQTASIRQLAIHSSPLLPNYSLFHASNSFDLFQLIVSSWIPSCLLICLYLMGFLQPTAYVQACIISLHRFDSA